MNKLLSILSISAFGILAAAGVAISAPVNANGLVTPDVIYGSGNANGSFTGQNQNNIEVGLRAHQRYPTSQNIFNYDGVNTYTFNSALLSGPTNRSLFNFDWSVNVDASGSSGAKLTDFAYLLSFDIDSSAATSYVSFNPFTSPLYFDHSLGNNSTANGGGVEAPDFAGLIANMALYNVAQQSSNLGFGFSADPDKPGIYGFKFEVFGLGTDRLLSSAEILVSVAPVPLPAGLPLMAAALGLFGLLGYRRGSKAIAAA